MEMQSKYLIVGPGRSGKTTFTNYLFENHKSIIGLPVEGLFFHFWNRRYYYLHYNKKIFMLEYLTKQRGIAENKQTTARPIDYFKSPLSKLLNINTSSNNKMSLINTLLDAFAADYNTSSWAITDCHSEYYYERYKKNIPNLKLLFVFRDPRETVCSNIYWRRKIDPRNVDLRFLQHYTLAWAISVQHYLKLKDLYPNDVHCIYISHDVEEIRARYSHIFDSLDIDFDHFMHTSIIKKMYYSFSNGLFLDKHNNYEELLPETHIDFIDYFCNSLVQRAFEIPCQQKVSQKLLSQGDIKYCFDILSIGSREPLTALHRIGFASIRDRNSSTVKYYKKALEFASRNKQILNYLLLDRSKPKL